VLELSRSARRARQLPGARPHPGRAINPGLGALTRRHERARGRGAHGHGADHGHGRRIPPAATGDVTKSFGSRRGRSARVTEPAPDRCRHPHDRFAPRGTPVVLSRASSARSRHRPPAR
jgi:hypothetical protein